MLAKEQTGCETGRLARHGDMIRLPHLAVFVHQSVTPAGRAVPDALLGPDGWMKSQREQKNKRMNGKFKKNQTGYITRRGQLKRPGRQRSRGVLIGY